MTRSPARRLASVLALAALMLGCVGANAHAARVIVLTRSGQAIVRNDPSLPAGSLMPEPAPAPSTRPVEAPRAAASHGAGRTVTSVLATLARTRQITHVTYVADRSAFDAALKEVRALPAVRGDELEAVIENLHEMAVDGTLTATRLPALFLTLDRNRQYWRSGPLLVYGQRVEFAGSELVWEYYPGQGIELQQLASFGKANWYCTHGAADRGLCRAILSELIPLAAQRAGGLVWEYDFHFDGGAPPWTSAMSQATGLQALAHGYRDLGDATYLTVGHSALSAFTRRPPSGVGMPTPLGMRFVQYTFAPSRGDEVINAFLQTLIGLHEYARASGDPLAKELFEAGDAEAESELPSFNTGAWSLYQPGVEDDLSYHELVTGFLQTLCRMMRTPIYCTTAAAFKLDLTTPPALSVLTTRVRARHAAELSFTLSKIGRVGIAIRRNGTIVFETSAVFPYGTHAFAVPALKPGGTDTVTLDATDLAGNYRAISAPLTVSKR